MSPSSAVVQDIMKENYTSVADYYNGKSIFITGGTGFLGKMYIQKLLYSCPGMNKIYMLVRAKSKEEAEHRIMQMLENSSQLFKQLKEETPASLLKLVPIVGDLSAPNLGIHLDDELLLREEVSIVVNSAATIVIRDSLKNALSINVTGTQKVLVLAKRMKKLQAFIHISTTFCAMNPDNKFIEEIVYPPPINLNDIHKLQEQYGNMRQPPKSISCHHLNTYTFTKAISEYIVHLHHVDLPTAIIRPSMVGSAHTEPYKGWLDVMNLHSLLLYAISNGQIRALNIDRNAIWDFIPVDYVANLMILAATKCKRSNDIDVYNCASSFINPVKLSDALAIFISDFSENKSSEMSPSSAVVQDIMKENYTSVADYYNGKSIFITGGTGFLGKMYIQKLLYSCPGMNKIYMLVRAKSKEEAEHRIMQMLENSSQLFKQLKEETPASLLKLVPIVGDLSAPNLGIHLDDELLLREEVSIVVNSAATIVIRDSLKNALSINVTGTQKVLVLAKRMKKLQAFIHISTTFCAMNPDNKFIEEIVYPPPINLNDIHKLQEQYGNMRQPPKSISCHHLNTYTFTKAISEYIVHLHHVDLPTAIIRPSMVGSAHTEPYKGWLDVMNLHSLLLYAISNGQIRALNIDRNAIWDFIPVDYVANLMILAATKCKRSNDIDVYNCASSFINPVKLSDALAIFISDFSENKSNRMPFPFVLYLKSKNLFDLLTPIVQSTQAHISDFSCLFTGQKPNSVKFYRKIMEFNDDFTFYGSGFWKAKSDRVISLISTLSDEDKKTFPCDPMDINWNEYFKKYSEAVRNYAKKIYNKSKL